MLHRREFLKASILGSVATAIKMPVVQAQSDSKARTRIVFLGTKGGPRVEMGRSNPANLVEINGTRVILDCGMGVTHQLAAAKVPLTSVKYILISHHHSDHNLEYGNLVYNAWATGLSQPVDAFGPRGLEEMTRNFFALNRFDIETRIADEGKPDLRRLLFAKDILEPGPVMADAQVQVTAFRTPHPPIEGNFAYRF